MTVRGFLVTLTALVAALPGVPARAAGAQLVVTGSRTAYAEVTFDEPFSFGNERSNPLSYTLKGTYAGLAVLPIGRAPGFGNSLLVLAAPAFSRYDVRTGLPDQGLPAGRYRVYLLADGPATVRLAFTGGGRKGQKVRPTRAARDGLVRRALPPPPGPGQPVSAAAPLTAPQKALGLVAVEVDYPGSGVTDLGACTTTPGGTCGDPLVELPTPHVVVPAEDGDYASGRRTYSHYGMPAGRVDVVWWHRTVGPVLRAGGVAYWLLPG